MFREVCSQAFSVNVLQPKQELMLPPCLGHTVASNRPAQVSGWFNFCFGWREIDGFLSNESVDPVCRGEERT